MKTVHPLYSLLRRLEEANIHFTLGRYRDDSILVTATVPDERFEIDVYEDGHMEISHFSGSEEPIGDEGLIEAIIENYSDCKKI